MGDDKTNLPTVWGGHSCPPPSDGRNVSALRCRSQISQGVGCWWLESKNGGTPVLHPFSLKGAPFKLRLGGAFSRDECPNRATAQINPLSSEAGHYPMTVHHTQHARKTPYRGNRRRRFRRMDRSLSPPPWRASHPHRRMGAGQFALVLRRRNPHHSRHLRTQPALHENGRPRHAPVERTRSPLGTQAATSHRRSMDGHVEHHIKR
jgi:hypothetical protein